MDSHDPTESSSDTVLSMLHITKQYPGVLAVDDVSFHLRRGEVHALVGENGAGKSTLMKILAGAVPRDAGEILIDGRAAEINSPQDAMAAGVSTIYQEFNLVPYLSVAENIYLGREPTVLAGFVDWRRMRHDAAKVLKRIGAEMSPRTLVKDLSVAEQQMTEIAKALSTDAKVIVMDEPSATLTEHELDALFRQIQRLKSQGVSVVYISHRLEEVFEVADRVTVLRDGRLIGTHDVADVDHGAIVRMMVGRELEYADEAPSTRDDEVLLSVRGLSRGTAVRDVSFDLYRGEIIGIAGLVGAGRTELARLIFGADRRDAGEIRLYGQPVPLATPREAIRRGIGFVTEDRKLQGLILGMALKENVTLANLDEVTSAGFIRKRREDKVASDFVKRLDIRTPSVAQLTINLSGGNQQKVVLAKWLFTRSRVLIFDEPTRGIDVGSKAEIHNIMRQVAAEGAGVIMISSELPEILKMSDRILVMREGRLVGELARAEATQERIMLLATGGADHAGAAEAVSAERC
ncbi:MAG: sugar ABC transporter ATP-binding protein [Armatimonadota bacterium]